MSDAHLLSALFARFGVQVSEAEIAGEADAPPREAITMMLANREIAARFDAAHGRPPDDNDIDELLDIYLTLKSREGGTA